MVQATQTVDAHADETRRRDLEVRRTFAKREMAIREITMHSIERKRTGNPQTQISTCLPEHAYYRRRWIDGHEGEPAKDRNQITTAQNLSLRNPEMRENTVNVICTSDVV